MVRNQDRMSRKAINREFPHVVEVVVPANGLGKRLNAMHGFHTSRGIKACLGRGRREESRDYLRWYFTRAATAEAFAVEFDGSYLRALSKKA
jgi:hypothetical protein